MARACEAPPVAVVLKGYPRLSETFIAQELEALEARGIAFEIWSLRAPYDDQTHPIHSRIRAPVHYLPEYLHVAPLRVMRALWHAARLPGFAAALGLWLRDLRRDLSVNRARRFGQAAVLAAELPPQARLLYAHFLHTPASVARYAAHMRGVPWGVSAHAKDIWTSPDWEKVEKLADAAFALTCTASGAAHLAGLAPTPDHVALAYHGLDIARFAPPPERRAHGGPLRLLSVGRLVTKKGYDDLLAALARLPHDLDWRFEHIGGGALEAEMRGRAEALGLGTRIAWRGKQARQAVIEAMAGADLFVLPSKVAPDGDRDGLPNVLLEAAAVRLPVLSTAVSAILEFIEDGVHGRLVPPSDPPALADAIVALAADPAGRATLAAQAHARLKAAFTVEPGIAVVAAKLRAALADPAADTDRAEPVSMTASTP